MNLGICMAGNEGAFAEALTLAFTRPGVRQTFVYWEIGIGHGQTLRGVYEFLRKQSGARPVKCFGVDLPGYRGAAIDPQNMGAGFRGVVVKPDPLPPDSGIWVAPVGAAEWMLNAQHQPDFIFIDGCHGKACVLADFYKAETSIAPGGIVAFHDTDSGCQGIHWQPHCGEFINVRAALKELGLLGNKRDGWKMITETTGDKRNGGHGMAFFQRL